MRLTLFLSLVLALTPGVSAQTSASFPIGPAVRGDEGTEPPAGEVITHATVVERPSDVVARLARQALTSPRDTAAWKALAGALPAMALSGGADLEGTFEAARLADSLSADAGTGGSLGGSTPSQDARSAMTRFAAVLATPRGRLAVLVFGLAVLAGGLVGVRARRPRRARSGEAPRKDAGRLWTARTLATGGTAIPEIARRTGMAQDAVDLALRLSGSTSPAPARVPARPLAPQAPVRRRSREDARLRREVSAGVGRLRDRRLTYGGGMAS